MSEDRNTIIIPIEPNPRDAKIANLERENCLMKGAMERHQKSWHSESDYTAELCFTECRIICECLAEIEKEEK